MTGELNYVSAAIFAIHFGGLFCVIYFLILFSFQILTSVQPSPITVMSMLSVITLMDRITAHAALDTLEMEHHALVNHKLYPVHLTLYNLHDTEAAHQWCF